MRLRFLALDWRMWALTTLLLGWYVLGTVTPDANPIHLITDPIFALMYIYYVSLGLLTVQLGSVSFWVGFVVYCFAIAVVIVWSVDMMRSVLSKRGRSEIA